MIRVEERLLEASGELRLMVESCRRLARDVKIRLVYDEMRLRGDGYNLAVRRLCRRFQASPSTVKRAIRRRAPPWERKERGRSEPLGEARERARIEEACRTSGGRERVT